MFHLWLRFALDFTETVYWISSSAMPPHGVDVTFDLNDSVTGFKVWVDAVSKACLPFLFLHMYLLSPLCRTSYLEPVSLRWMRLAAKFSADWRFGRDVDPPAEHRAVLQRIQAAYRALLRGRRAGPRLGHQRDGLLAASQALRQARRPSCTFHIWKRFSCRVW